MKTKASGHPSKRVAAQSSTGGEEGRVQGKGAKAKINARISALQGFPIFPEQYFSAYKSAPGLFELRISFAGVQYRPFGFYGPSRKQFCLLVGGIEKGKIPKSLLRIADDRRKVVERDHSRAKPHDFS